MHARHRVERAGGDLGGVAREGEARDAVRVCLDEAAHAEAIEIKPRRVFQVLRISISGKTVTAGLFESLEVLGKEESLARLQFAKNLISN